MEYLSRKAEREQLQIEWRRSKVLEYQSMGLSQRETAEILKVGSGTVARDQIALREQAKENIANYMDHLPQDYQIALTGLTAIIRKAWVMVNEANNIRDKAIVLNLLKDTIGMRFPLEESIVAATAATTESLPALKTGQTHKPTSTKIKTFVKEKEKPLNLYESEYDIQLQKEYEEYRRVYGSILDKEEKESKT